ncbi:MAG TPA: hypothetical protein ENI60_02865 [Candidatus Fraserbacteria bacterium]|nr:hypothetical protein [Candidatus Fraserbacteria bacterium]
MRLQERIEFRTDTQTKHLLEELARSRRASLGELLRSLVERQLDELGWKKASQAEAAQDLLSLSVGPLPGPEELQEEIADAFAAED